MTTVIAIAVIILLTAFLRSATPIEKILSHWHHRFSEPPFSPQEFYDEVRNRIKQKEMDKLSLSRVTYSQGGFLSPSREYLRIRYKEFIYDICAAPFGKEFFVSWWLGEARQSFQNFLKKIPILGQLVADSKREKTFYELDTEIMFKEAVSACVKEAITNLTEQKGKRDISAINWQSDNSYTN